MAQPPIRKMSKGYAAVIGDPTGAVALGLLRTGIKKVALVYPKEFVQPFPTTSDPSPRDLSYNALTVKLVVRRLLEVIEKV
jgi:hypothetical protein